MLLKNKELTLRTAFKSDADILLKWWNDGDIMAHAGFNKGLNITKDKVEENIASNNNTRELIIVEYENKPIGEMNYRLICKATAKIGIKICNFDMQNKGIGTMSLRMLINYLFDEKKYTKIILDTNLSNKRAQHVYEKLGFEKVGIKKDSHTDQNGVEQSTVDYVLTKNKRLF